jgi:hypothetical protein
MRYCARCGSEDQMHERGLPLPHEWDERRFVRAGIADDPVTAQVFADVLDEQRIPLIVRPGRSGVVDELTTGNLLPWWELLVPDTQQARAAALLEEVKVQGLANADEAALAAEEEEREEELGRASSLDAQPPAY